MLQGQFTGPASVQARVGDSLLLLLGMERIGAFELALPGRHVSSGPWQGSKACPSRRLLRKSWRPVDSWEEI